VGVRDRPHLQLRVVVRPAIQPIGTEKVPGHDRRSVDLLPRVRHGTAFHEIDHCLGQETRVDTEVVVAAQLGQHGVGRGTDADLNGGPVGHERGDQAGDGAIFVSDRARRELDRRAIVTHHRGELRGVDCGVAVRVGHPRVDLGDRDTGSRDRGLEVVGDQTE
jgi:hypothetical protein